MTCYVESKARPIALSSPRQDSSVLSSRRQDILHCRAQDKAVVYCRVEGKRMLHCRAQDKTVLYCRVQNVDLVCLHQVFFIVEFKSLHTITYSHCRALERNFFSLTYSTETLAKFGLDSRSVEPTTS